MRICYTGLQEENMIYHTFHGDKLSALGFGAMRLPVIDGDDARIDEAAAAEMVSYALSHGINYFDTAWAYHGGNSERVLGKILQQYPRETYFLSTKFPGFNPLYADKVEEIFEEQLKRTGAGYFDFYLLHNVLEADIDTYLNPKHRIVAYLKKQKELGRIRHLGFSAHGSLNTIRRFLEVYGRDMEFCQLQVNWVDWSYQGAEEKVELLRSYGIPLWVMEPMRGGKLSRLPEEMEKKLRTLRPEESTAAWSFRFIQSLDSALLTLSGASTLSQLAENIAVFEEEKPVSDEEKQVLFEIAKEISRGVPCTRCRYCLSHCPQNLDIPRLISIYNDEVFSEGGRITRLHLSALPADRQPASCVSCGECTKMCPQGISVPDILRDFVKRLG